MNQLMNELLTEVFVEQPLALPGSAKKTMEGWRRILRYGLNTHGGPEIHRGIAEVYFRAARSISKIVSTTSPQRPRQAGARPRPLWRC